MTKDEKQDDFQKILDKDNFKAPQVGDTVKGEVISASKSEVKLDIGGILIGVVRGPELYEEAEEYADLKSGDEVEATVIDDENENNELELSFRFAGQEKAWANLRDAFKSKEAVKVKIVEANKGGLLAKFRQIAGFLPVSQLAPENYPRVSGGDKSKILEKLKSFIGSEFEVQVITLDEKEDKIIFSEKNLWGEKQKNVISKYKVGTKVEGVITAVTNFGVFISFDENMEGLVHISELAWQRIDSPSNLYNVGDKLKAEVINIDGTKIFLSAKKLLKDPWQEAPKRYKTGKIVKGEILKVNPFGLFVKLDENIHGLAHISQLGLAPGQNINELFFAGEKKDFEVMAVEPKEHRLGLKVIDKKKGESEENDKDVKKKQKANSLPTLPTGKAGKSIKKEKEEKKPEVKKEKKKVESEKK